MKKKDRYGYGFRLFAAVIVFCLLTINSGVDLAFADGIQQAAVPVTPANFHVVSVTQTSITLGWDDVAGESGYKIYKWNGTTFLPLATLSTPNITTYTDTKVTCGLSFYYKISAYNASGESALSDQLQGSSGACPPPTNDAFSAATLIATNPYAVSINTSGATKASDDPSMDACNLVPGNASVWYRYVPSQKGHIKINAMNSNYDTILGVFTGTQGNLSLVFCNDDSSDGGSVTFGSQIRGIPVSADTTYYIEVAQFANPRLESQSLKENIKGLATTSDITSLALVGGVLDLKTEFALGPVFSDVPDGYWAQSWITALYNAGVTSGCGGGKYCPDDPVTRAQMAVFLLRAKNFDGYFPPKGSGTVFKDVPSTYWAVDWIEQMAADKITSGCGSGNFCPANTATRAQMAVFLLRAKHGPAYLPPAAKGVFKDVPVTHWAAGWIEQMAAEGITSGCGSGNFCPDNTVNRAQMAVFLIRGFNLPAP